MINLLASGYYDFETGSAWTPHVGVGMGLIIFIESIALPSVKGSVGVTWAVAEQLALNLNVGIYTVLTLPLFVSIDFGVRYRIPRR